MGSHQTTEGNLQSEVTREVFDHVANPAMPLFVGVDNHLLCFLDITRTDWRTLGKTH
jgi:hypothetical protein